MLFHLIQVDQVYVEARPDLVSAVLKRLVDVQTLVTAVRSAEIPWDVRSESEFQSRYYSLYRDGSRILLTPVLY